jgi:hypothetical protein
VQRLREEEAMLEQKKADLESTFGDRHPMVERADSHAPTEHPCRDSEDHPGPPEPGGRGPRKRRRPA